MVRSAMGGGMLMMSVSSMTSLAGVSLTGILGAALPIVVVPVFAGLVYSGLKGALSGQVKNAQGELRKQMMEMLQQVRRHFFDADLSAGSFSRVDEYFKTLERTVNEQVQELVR